MRHKGSIGRRRQWLVAAVTGAFFLVTLVLAALWLPPQIEMYYTPTDRADVAYQLWQYLILLPIGCVVLAVALAAFARAIVAGFGSGGATAEVRVMARVSSWVFVSSSAAVWVAVWLGNDHPEQRSWLESAIALTGILGSLAIVAVELGRARQRPTEAHR